MQEILEILRSVVDAVTHFVSYIVKLFAIVGEAIAYITMVFSYLPAWVSAGILVIVSISVILMILNRG